MKRRRRVGAIVDPWGSPLVVEVAFFNTFVSARIICRRFDDKNPSCEYSSRICIHTCIITVMVKIDTF